MAISQAKKLTKNRHPTQPGVVLKWRRTFEVAGAPVTTQTPGRRPSSKYRAGTVTVFSPQPGYGNVGPETTREA
jgi:hypothetical protein